MKPAVTPAALAFLDRALDEARTRGLLRERETAPPAPSAVAGGGATPAEPLALSFCSNDYLALASEPAPAGARGAGASRLVAGDRPVHAELEGAAAALVGQPAALVFSSGYAANVGLVAALAGPGDLVVSDALNHASLVDGARLSRARIEVAPHIDAGAVERVLRARREPRAFVLTESYFSMDADSPDLPALRRVCDAYGAALVVDEAHALGVLGPEGRGLCAQAGVAPDALVGTFGKAFGAGGAFVAGCPALAQWLWNRARPFVFSTGLSPVLARAALAGLETAAAEPARRERVHAAAAQLRAGLGRLGLRVVGEGHIVPWVVGEAADAMSAAARLRELGLDVRAIRPPSVPPGTARLRLTVTAAHGGADLERALEAFRRVVER